MKGGRVLISMVRQVTRAIRPGEVARACGHCGQPCWVTLDSIEHADVMVTRGRRAYFYCIDCIIEGQKHGS